MAVAVLTVYGLQVDQMMAALPPMNLGATLLIPYAAVYGVRRLFEKRFVTSADDLSQPRRQLLLDFSLNICAGLLATTLNRAIYGFPILSMFGFVYGVAAYGFFIALDTALARERMVILVASHHHTSTVAPRRFSSMTRRLLIVAVVSAISVSVVIVLAISLDMAWLKRVGPDPASIEVAVWDITCEILFIIGALLGHGINLIFSYSRNLKLLFKNETRVLEKVSRGDLSCLVPVTTQDEFGLSAVHINSMIEGLRHRIQLLTALKLAEEVQRNLLPLAPLTMPGIDLSGTSIYCEETGGDYWDYLLLPGGRLGVVAADASGHGVDAALFMSTARAFLISGAKHYQGPANLLDEVNRYLCRDGDCTCRFISMFFLEIDVTGKTLCWVRGGHEPALLFNPFTADFQELGGVGMALGVTVDFKHKEYTQFGWESQTVIVIGTDGVSEARNSSGEPFGTNRMKEVIRSHASEPAACIQSALIQASQNFRGGTPQEDDMTLLVVKLS
jgi:sigma-B regulation protein RsbU (phosphoserine phosphatase)